MRSNPLPGARIFVREDKEHEMKDKLRVTDDGEVYVDGVLRLVGQPDSVRSNGDMQAHLLRLESEALSPLDRIVHESVMKAYGFTRDDKGVWRQASSDQKTRQG
jgi:hypothetical protein